MTISVLIATYNRGGMLARCLEHLLRQAFEPGDEVVIVDNGSTDDTANVVREAATRASVPVRYLMEPAAGKSRALMTGLSVARGDVLALTDDDVVVSNDWIATIRNAWRQSNPGLVGGRVMPLWERPAPAWLQRPDGKAYGPLSAPLALLDYGPARVPLGARTALGANMAVSRRALDEAGGFPLDLGKLRGTLLSGEDHQICERVQAAGYTAVYDPRLVVRHHVAADRLRFAYHLRWFFWSGITNAALDATTPGATRVRAAHWAARVSTGGIRVLRFLLAGRRDQAAEAAVDIAFSLGYVAGCRGWVRPHPAAPRAASRRLEAL
ncbi:MAG: glycosyltransferase [Bacteroidales bacterium]